MVIGHPLVFYCISYDYALKIINLSDQNNFAMKRLIFCIITLLSFTILSHAQTREDFQSYLTSAKNGDMYGQYNAGVCYLRGLGVSQNYEQAAYWFRKSADQGLADAQYALANRYYNGEGVTQDYVQAVDWYRKAADQGFAVAQNNLGVCYGEGRGVSMSKELAVVWYRKSAENGNTTAMTNLARYYEDGDGVEEDIEMAVYWASKAADLGDEDAQYIMGRYYDIGYGVDEDDVIAAGWYEKAALQGHDAAQYRLGIFYRFGYGVEENQEKYLYWTKKAADQGYDFAQSSLMGYYKNNTESKDAFNWYQNLANKGDSDAQYRMGQYYFDGDVVERDYAVAKGWYEKAASNGNDDAQMALDAPQNKKIWKGVIKEQKKEDIRRKFRYAWWDFTDFMSEFNCPKGYGKPFGISAGYVSKDWIYTYADGSTAKASVFDEKTLHGLQAGIRWEPVLKYGFAFDTGLYYEYYNDKSDLLSDVDDMGAYNYYMIFQEHNIHFPVHVEYRLNFSRNFQMFAYAGASLDYALYGRFDCYEDGYDQPYYTVDEGVYTDDVMTDTRRFNASLSFGAGFRIYSWQINAGHRMGLVNMSSSSEYVVKQNNPLNITVSFMF